MTDKHVVLRNGIPLTSFFFIRPDGQEEQLYTENPQVQGIALLSNGYVCVQKNDGMLVFYPPQLVARCYGS